MDIPPDFKYTEEHEWATLEDDRARFGITDFAQEQLGDIVYVELPQVGDTLTAMEPCGTVDSVKASSDLFSPLSGTVVEVNERLEEEPELVNQDPYGDGWLVAVELSERSEFDHLLSAEDYAGLVEEEDE